MKAAHYYRQLAELGQAKSQLALATTYFLLSEEQPELLKYAHMWAELAARQDLDEASQWRSDFSGKQEFLDGVELADACWDANFEECEPNQKLKKLSMEELWQARKGKAFTGLMIATLSAILFGLHIRNLRFGAQRVFCQQHQIYGGCIFVEFLCLTHRLFYLHVSEH